MTARIEYQQSLDALEASVQEIGKQIFDLVVATASGRKTKSEELGFGEDEFAPWQFGAVM